MSRFLLLALSSCFFLAFLNPSLAGWPLDVANPPTTINSPSQMLKRVMPAVVNIVSQGNVPLGQLLPTSEESNSRPHRFQSIGSGVIVDAAGLILTNAHVLQNSKSIVVTLSNDRTYKAKLIGSDPESDIALIQISAKHLKAIPFGNSDSVQVGDPVVAIGSPFGLNQTATSGIISALQRTRVGIEGYENFIQTDAPINLGNSGGALVNLQGDLIGINTAIFAAGTLGNIGIGFAIPINMARGIMQQLIKYGAVHRGLIGVWVQDLTPSLLEALHLPENSSGALVNYAAPYYPAAKAGMGPGDIIQAINGQRIQNAGQVKNIIGMLRVGDRVNVQLLKNGQSLNLSLPIMDLKQHLSLAETQNPFLFGLGLRNFDRTLIGVLGRVVGVQVVKIDENSMAWHSGIRPGDVIISANQTPISTVEQLQQIARKTRNQLLVNIVSETNTKFIVIKP